MSKLTKPLAIASCSLLNAGGPHGAHVAAKVCLISRGEVAFSQKVESCQAGGGFAAIIYNNESGNFSGTVEGASATIPAVSISLEDGQMLMAQQGS